jgi:hypothetical protein
MNKEHPTAGVAVPFWNKVLVLCIATACAVFRSGALEVKRPAQGRDYTAKQTQGYNTSDAKERLQRARSCLRCALQFSICSA